MPHCSDLPDDPVYALCPAYDPSWLPQRIRIPGDHGLCPHRLDCIHPRRRRALSATGSTSASVSTERHGRLLPAAPCSLAWTKAGCIDPPKSPRRNRRRNQAAAPGRQRYARRSVTSSRPWAEHCHDGGRKASPSCSASSDSRRRSRPGRRLASLRRLGRRPILP